jgi:endoglucanase
MSEDSSEEIEKKESEKDDYKRLKDYTEDIINLKRICDVSGCTGNEDKARAVLKDMIKDHVDKIEVDSMGNLFGIVEGQTDFKLMIDAHMDEIGFIVKFIDASGFLRVAKVGGQNVRILPASRLRVHGYTGQDVPGIFGEKAIHLMNAEQRKKVPDFENLFIDIGARNKKEAEKLVALGDYVTFETNLERFPDTDRVYGKSLDDRVGCYIIYELLKRIKQSGKKPQYTIIAVFSTQEEIGTRGATIASYAKDPDLAVVLEVTHSIDFPGGSKQNEGETVMGKGPEVSVGPNLNPKITKTVIETARKHNIPLQIGVEPGLTGTNARAIQLTRAGVPCTILAPPLRYMHTTIETIDMNDIELTIQLLVKLLDETLPRSYNPE